MRLSGNTFFRKAFEFTNNEFKIPIKLIKKKVTKRGRKGQKYVQILQNLSRGLHL